MLVSYAEYCGHCSTFYFQFSHTHVELFSCKEPLYNTMRDKHLKWPNVILIDYCEVFDCWKMRHGNKSYLKAWIDI